MKQLLLRVPEELHARLTAQAQAKGISVNALANDLLGLGIDPAQLSRTDRLRLKLIQLGEVSGSGRRPPSPSPDVIADLEALRAAPGERDEIDELIAWQRGADRWP